MNKCGDCGMVRPRWHGGAHKCLKIGDSYRLTKFHTIDEAELAFLSAPGREAA